VGATVSRRRLGLAEVTPGPFAAEVERWCLEALRPDPRPRGVCYSTEPRGWCRFASACRSCVGSRP
jgi:hypothetical protein